MYGKQNFIDGGAIIAANHSSFLDPIIVGVSIPKEEIHFLARSTLFKSFFGRVIRSLNAHPIKMEGKNSNLIKKTGDLIKDGKKVVIFPEGSRSKDGNLQKIKPGIGLLLSKSGSAILPTYIAGSYEIWNKNQRLPRPFGSIRVVFGSPIFWKDFENVDKKQSYRLIANKFYNSILSLKKWEEDGRKGPVP